MQDDFAGKDLAAIERTTREVGRYLLQRATEREPHVFQRRWWDQRVMSWAMQDEAVKVQMFRFVDVLPMLHDSGAVIRHLEEYLGRPEHRLPSALRTALRVGSAGTIAGRALAIAARRNVLGQARRFIAGTNTEEVLAAAMRQRKLRRAFTLDVLGEAVISESEADRYLEAYVNLIERLAPVVNRWSEVPQIDRGVETELPRVNVSVKLSALDCRFDPLDPAGTARRVGARLRHLLRVARQHRAFVNVDMESHQAKDLTLDIFRQIMLEDEFRDVGDVGIVIQAYLRDADRDLAALCQWARERGRPVWVRLVKGAYWDYETVHAAARGWPLPVFRHKWQTDAQFERCTRYLLRNYRHLRPALASHNIRSLAHGIATARHIGLPPLGFELQMLYGMGDEEKQALVELGHRLRIYMPFGELIPGMAYLVRRLLENTSNDSFLRASYAQHVPPEVLLMNPLDRGDGAAPSAPPQQPPGAAAEADAAAQTAALPGGAARQPLAATFVNEPWTDFAVAENRARFEAALRHVAGQWGRHEPLVIGGQPRDTREKIRSLNPSHKGQVLGSSASAAADDVDRAVRAAHAAAPHWLAIGAAGRAEQVCRVADVLRSRRFELAAWIVYECGKPWREADADVAEAIDFCEFYAEQALALVAPRGADVPGEENRFVYHPRGVAAVIAPWNFPLAILTGMTMAALVMGNPVVMKPAEQSTLVGAQLMHACLAADLPPGVVNYLPGRGETAGAALVDHPLVALVAFTGSQAVGLAIHRRAAELSGQTFPGVKKVIAEMGGKNAVIVDSDADLDEAVLGVAHSALGYAGQKCSAASRVIVLDDVYEPFVARLVEAARSLAIGPAEEPGTFIGPVIDDEARTRIERYIALGRDEGRLALEVDVGHLAEEGYYVGPHIFTDVAPTATIAQEEIFGPVLAVLRARDLDEAFEIFHSTRYALTGGIFSRSPAHLDRARRELLVGNLYLNRPITGALVCRQPFGGFRLSGIGSQAGGEDYLRQFVVPRTITENTMRRGFAPSSG